MKSDEQEVKNIANKIRKTLKSEGIYSPMFDMSIIDLAQVTHLKNKAFDDAINYKYPELDEVNRDTGKKSIVVEQSREGFLRYKVNPAYLIYLDLVDKSQKILTGMCMTAKSSNSIQDDDFDDLKKKVEDAMSGVKS